MTQHQGKQRAVFLDRDGVINRDRPDYVKSTEEVVLLPGAIEAIARLSRAGWSAVIISNQAGVGKGVIPEHAVNEIHTQLTAAVKAAGGRIDGVYYCPHREEEGCGCRKPRAGLLLQAANDLALELAGSYLIGDSLRDIGAARAAGVVPILVGKKSWAGGPRPALEVGSLAEATDWILARQ